ncbi:ubiquinone/menaquinone biosynthesis methyltransferase UbiE [Chloropicon roscoffensis]|uniref:2-methoxy-6-polyprenyl-1,4-benzoquinol methylase, mitochondrial n=1 Tax=Chloropicon roscoffensis TaxID=1461544 RepID=A0AAX4P5L5_9CHLO|mmetsp:Transcript_254/g.822  ORF Transcript_254/g.822 Transcript_254/m.822 type:complete len:329 (-) Transcript_254:691-1677(-)
MLAGRTRAGGVLAGVAGSLVRAADARLPSLWAARLLSTEAEEATPVGSRDPRRPGPKADDEEVGDSVSFGFSSVDRSEHKGLVKDVFEKVAPKYDAMNDFMSFFLHRHWKDRFVGITLHPFAGQKHLDVAGGTGDVGFRVLREIRRAEEALAVRRNAEVESAGEVCICDINGAMLEEGKKKVAGLDIRDAERGLSWVESDAESLPFDDESFDTYTISFGIRNVSDIDACLSEARRVLKRGGHFCCLEFSQVNNEVLRQVYDLYSMNVIPYIGQAYAGDAHSYQYLVESIRKFPDQEHFKEIIEANGFRGVRYENLLDGVVAIHSGFKL